MTFIEPKIEVINFQSESFAGEVGPGASGTGGMGGGL